MQTEDWSILPTNNLIEKRILKHAPPENNYPKINQFAEILYKVTDE